MLNKLARNISDNEKYALYFFGTLILCGLVFFYIIRPLAIERGNLETTTLQANTELAKLQTFAGQNQDYDALVKLQEAKLNDAKKKMPDKVSVPLLINEYNKLAEENDIYLESLTPMEETKAGNAFAIPMEITLRGDYFHMVNFLEQLEKGERFVTLQAASFGSQQEGGSLTMTARFMVYSLNGSDMTTIAPLKEDETKAGKIGHEGEIEKAIKDVKN